MSSTASYKKVMYLDAEEIPEEVSATVTGEIPPWLHGTLIRNGPGKFNIGKDKLRHWFDGLALLHRFSIADGQVSYYNKFLRSQAYVQGMEKQRVMKNEFATNASPDPCKSLFARFFSYFQRGPSKMTDNCLVSVIPIKGQQYAASEINTMVQIDPDSLEVLGKVNILKEFPGESTSQGNTGRVTVPWKRDFSLRQFDRTLVSHLNMIFRTTRVIHSLESSRPKI